MKKLLLELKKWMSYVCKIKKNFLRCLCLRLSESSLRQIVETFSHPLCCWRSKQLQAVSVGWKSLKRHDRQTYSIKLQCILGSFNFLIITRNHHPEVWNLAQIVQHIWFTHKNDGICWTFWFFLQPQEGRFLRET